MRAQRVGGWIAALLLALAGVVNPLGGQATRGGVAGRVLGPDGKPVAGMRVAVVGTVADAEALVSLGQTDELGRFRLEDVSPGRYLLVAGPVTAPTYFPRGTRAASAEIVPVVAGKTSEGLDIVLAADAVPPPAFATITGKVSGANGEPAVDAPVAAVESSGRVISLQHTVAPSGEYYIEVPPGRYVIGIPYLRALGDDAKPPSNTQTVTVGSNAALKNVDLEIRVPVRELPRLLDISPPRQPQTRTP